MTARCHCAVQVDLDTVDVLARFWGIEAPDPGRGRRWDQMGADALQVFQDLLSDHGCVATMFATGSSLDDGRFADLVRAMCEQGHEVANHTQDHPEDLTGLGPRAREEQLDACAEAIQRVTGRTPMGFRAPSYRVNVDLLRLLQQRGYAYDSSIMPSPSVLLMKAHHGLLSRGRGENPGPGVIRHCRAPRAMHRASSSLLRGASDSGDLVEVPISTAAAGWIPLTSTVLGMLPVYAARALLRRRAQSGVPMTFVLHLVDLVDGRLLPGALARTHPLAGRPLHRKRRWCSEMLQTLSRECRMVTTLELARACAHGEPVGRG